MKIPYGLGDFGQIRSEGFFYDDKTPPGARKPCESPGRGALPQHGPALASHISAARW